VTGKTVAQNTTTAARNSELPSDFLYIVMLFGDETKLFVQFHGSPASSLGNISVLAGAAVV
jgi:hypothetical protein